MFQSQTYGKVDYEGVAKGLQDFYTRTKQFDTPFQITVGTDSQSFSKETKIVSVIAAHREGHGGVFFYEVTHLDKISNVKRKLTEETSRSIETATTLVDALEARAEYAKMRDDSIISIHVDAGWSEKGKTKELIPMLVGWIKATGFDALVKPDSYAASSIADKISK